MEVQKTRVNVRGLTLGERETLEEGWDGGRKEVGIT